MTFPRSHRLLLLASWLAFALSASAAGAQSFDRLVIFGDSLSDPGNHFIAFGTTSHQPFVPIPDASYAIGGHHFSNGATWAEQLAQDLHSPKSGGPALRAPGLFTNYAVGQARARAGAPTFPFYDLGTQVGLFLEDFGGHASGDSLYVIWIGADDVGDALSVLATDPSGATSAAIIEEAIVAVAGNVQGLWLSGARTFLIPNLPDLAITPAIRAVGPAAEFAAAQLTFGFNTALDQASAALQALPQIQLIRLDSNALFHQLLAAPAAAGLTNVDDACLTFGVIGHAICATPNRYLFWDGIHPTTAAHGVLAEVARSAVAP
jgi:phospholipase/lecithinase/hemolysin